MLLVTVLGLGLATVCGSGAVLWLAVHVLTRVPEGDVPMADVVDLLKVALAAGLSKWAASGQ
jgi:hypothetical protein